MKERPEPIERVKSLFNEIAPDFDSWFETLQGKAYRHVTWEHLKKHLPDDKNSFILDAGGGTGKWAVPLAKMGYRVMLCDISKGMLKQAEIKVHNEGLSDRVTIKEEDITNLSFSEGTFDFVICEDGPISISDPQKVVRELGRVLKKGGKIWAAVIGRYYLALANVTANFKKTLELSKNEINYAPYKGIERCRVFSPQEIQTLFQQNNIEMIKLYGNQIMIPSMSEEIKTMTDYDDKFFSEIADMELRLSEEPSLSGIAEFLQIVGEK